MIKFIKVDELLQLRNEVLRNGVLTPDECRFPSDNVDGNFHLGYFINDELACIASFHPQAYGDYTGTGYQLRGMATTEKYRGQGLGNQLVKFALNYLRQQGADYLWCNAREKAVRFYEGLGLEIISPQFEVPGIGPHYVMYVKIK
ncbi:GNAT family N-acetyltransferase [Mucilaginibacter celer]|uniref:GNAT family N-acetyltransferase n=1 Tax=Mucilaginibacter celer TaxID=2305508 RepID=A0A494VP49_9SPHI|nr:GNAT family N-acetyltransferase [Mucilaginibacter celer]AYL97226.1 GNAT family N-acetyltransferase [Mucilaginibacter celer]